jgi:hypothetical protein
MSSEKALSSIEVDEERLFKIIEEIDIDNNEYYDDLKMQKWSY